MRKYREEHAAYRERERLLKLRGRRPLPSTGVVTEAGQSSAEPARVYVVTGPRSEVWLHVVTAAGRKVTLCAEAAKGAGLGPLSAGDERSALVAS
jgi:hypothetical protein